MVRHPAHDLGIELVVLVDVHGGEAGAGSVAVEVARGVVQEGADGGESEGGVDEDCGVKAEIDLSGVEEGEVERFEGSEGDVEGKRGVGARHGVV